MKKIVFVFSHTPDPRINKRISIAKEQGDVTLIFWNRKAADVWGLQHKDIDNYEIIQKANYGHPLGRLSATFKVYCKAMKKLRVIHPQTIYAGNLDMLFIAVQYKKKIDRYVNIIYEIADLHRLIMNDSKKIIDRLVKKGLRKMESEYCKYINTLVLTSEKFYEVYYKEFVDKKNVLFLPNMPELVYFDKYQKKTTGNFTVGFIGAVRYKKQMKLLIEAAKKANVEVFFAGSVIEEEILEQCGNNVHFYGKYDYNTEIADLYSKVDCVYAVYDASLFNVRVALPNKLYEAIYCELPIIVAKGTYLAELVQKWKVGVAVDSNNPSELIEVLYELKNKDQYYNNFVENCIEKKAFINEQFYSDKLKGRF